MNKRRVAIYARVSTEHEAQLSALENQKDWYKPIIASHPEWQVVDMYTDEGITGTSAKKRPEFLRMINDAEDGLFDLIVTREVSRFARNTVDTLQYTRKLKTIGVEVFFINDNIKTFDGDGELRLTIMATLAQDESRKTSIRVKAGQQVSFKNGVLYGNGNILGYDRNGKELVVNEGQAAVVRKIFEMYKEGKGLNAIAQTLEKEGYTTSMGRTKWHPGTIKHILENPFYCGTIVYKKNYVDDYLTQKKKINRGEIEQIVIEGKHEPIISKDLFNEVQKIIESKKRFEGQRGYTQNTTKALWSRKLMCECGSNYNKHISHSYKDGRKTYCYTCNKQTTFGNIRYREKRGLSTDGICNTPTVAEWKLYFITDLLLNTLWEEKDSVVSFVQKYLTENLDFEEKESYEKELIDINAKIKTMENKYDTLVDMRLSGEISKDYFLNKKLELEKSINALKDRSEFITGQQNIEDVNYDMRFKDIIKSVQKYYDEYNEKRILPDQVVDVFIKKMVMHEDSLDIYLSDNKEKFVFHTPNKLNKPIMNEYYSNSNKAKNIFFLQKEQSECINITGCYYKWVANSHYKEVFSINATHEDAKIYLEEHDMPISLLKGYKEFKLNIYI